MNDKSNTRGTANEDPDARSEKEEQKRKMRDTSDQQQTKNDLTSEDIPDSTNESTGSMGSGQRQDSN